MLLMAGQCCKTGDCSDTHSGSCCYFLCVRSKKGQQHPDPCSACEGEKTCAETSPAGRRSEASWHACTWVWFAEFAECAGRNLDFGYGNNKC